MHKSFLWILFLVAFISSHAYEQYPKSVEQAEELLFDGLIDSTQYELFITLLMNPVDLTHDDLYLLYELFDSSDVSAVRVVYENGGRIHKSIKALEGYLEPYIESPTVTEKPVTGAVRSSLRCDSSGARASLYLRGGSETLTGNAEMSIKKQSLALDKRTVKVSLGKSTTTVGSFSLPLSIGTIKPLFQTEISDSLTLLYGSGRLFNGVLSTFNGRRFSLESSVSYLPTEQHVSGSVTKAVSFGSISVWGLGRKGHSSLCGGACTFSALTLQSIVAPESGASLAALKLRMGTSKRSNSLRALFFNRTTGLESLSLIRAVDSLRGVKLDVNYRESWKSIRLSASLSTLIQDYSSKVSLQGALKGGSSLKWNYSTYYLQQVKESLDKINKWIQKAGVTSPVVNCGLHGEGVLGVHHIKKGLEKITMRAGIFWQLGNSPNLSCVYRTSFNHLVDELYLGVEARESVRNRFGFSAILRPQDMKKTKLYSSIRFTF